MNKKFAILIIMFSAIFLLSACSTDDDSSSDDTSERSQIEDNSNAVRSIDGQDLSYEIPSSVSEKTSSGLFKKNLNPSECEFYGESDDLVVVFYENDATCVLTGDLSQESETTELSDFTIERLNRDTKKGENLYFDSTQANDDIKVGFLYKDINSANVMSDIEFVLESITQE